MTRTAFRGGVLHMLRDPAAAGEGPAYAYLEDAVLIVENGRIAQLCAFDDLAAEERRALDIQTFANALIIPGFIDAHIHYPQGDMIGAYGAQLMDWLERYTYPAEMRFADRDVAEAAAKAFLDELLRNGTTSAMVFATSHEHSVDALFGEALSRDMRLIAGKVLMDRGAPEALLDPLGGGGEASERLIEHWGGRGRLGYAVTPRFAPTSSEAQLAMAGDILARYPDVYLQTHISENSGEIDEVRRLFPNDADYLAVYERFGLVTARSVFAHGVHLDETGFERLARADAALAFCPTSNLFLGSGLLNVDAALRSGVRVGLATDVGGGTSFSMLATMAEAYKVAQLGGSGLDPWRLFYMATLGGAKALRIDDRVGSFEIGKEADFVVFDLAATPLLERRMAAAQS
ncbi:MAG: guanine deaminase, partial [Pseudomonadota bacterium]